MQPPVVDMAPIGSDPDGNAARAAIAKIDEACLDTGFFILVGHGLDHEMAAALDAARRFFALSQAEKERVPRRDRYGYVAQRAQALDGGRQTGRAEFVDLGLADEVPLPNVGGLEDAKGFEDAIRRYQRAALRVADTVLRLLSIALGLEREFFAARMRSPQCRLRLLHYPPAQLDGGALPVMVTPHTDYGAITLLATDGTPGLEVKPLDLDWTPVTTPSHALIVNLGDMLARWTNDRYRSTPHRVLGSPDHDRYSIPFFVNPDPATVVECAPSCVSDDRPARYEPVTAGEFLASRIDGSAEPYVDPDAGPARVAAWGAATGRKAP